MPITAGSAAYTLHHAFEAHNFFYKSSEQDQILSRTLKSFPSHSRIHRTKMMGADDIDENIQASEESFTRSETPQNPRKKNKAENKKRFSDEQIRSLECIFESESKLEPKKKIQVARDLGLQPRQVAIWFQNRRARGKSKWIEQEYRKLKDDYDNLASRFESLKREKESLQIELQKLNDLMETSHGGKMENSREWRSEVKPSFSSEGLTDREGMHLQHQNEMNQLLRMDEHEVPMGSLEKWYSGDASVFIDQPCSSSQWPDFWT